MNKWYDKDTNTFSVLTKDSLSVYELDELYNYPRLEIFNFLDVDLVSIKEVWQNWTSPVKTDNRKNAPPMVK